MEYLDDIDDTICNKLSRAINLVLDYAPLFTGAETFIYAEILKNHLSSIASVFTNEHDIKIAQDPSKDFVWLSQVWTKDINDLNSFGSLSELIRQRQSASLSDKINGDRMAKLFPNDPEYEKLYELADHELSSTDLSTSYRSLHHRL